MGMFNLTIGCLLIASWCNMILYTLEYAATFLWSHAILIVVTGCCIGACSAVSYLYSVSHWGGAWVLTSGTILTVAILVSRGPAIPHDSVRKQVSQCTYLLTVIQASGYCIQIWVTHMVFNLTKKWIWIPIIYTFILLGGIAAVATTYEFLRNPSLGLSHLATYVTAWLCCQAAADLIIAGVLVAKFRALKTNFIGTKHLIRRMSLVAVRNGSITTILMLEPQTNTATMIEASITPAVLSAIGVLFSMTIGRVYTLSMLVNLNSRRSKGATSQGSSSRKTTIASDHRKTAQEFNLSVLRIQRDVETHYQTEADAIPLENPDYGFQKAHDIEDQRHPNAAALNL
ncbi:hypothetical protein C8J57DRAFT_1651556 [Mycena rebaudengoi]|nr:hypothetical protein C8J57DRAFT_1651556 [Mycena rebaudengoi]